MNKPMIVLLGPTASGKTRIASLLAKEIGGEIISADSRQIYRGMDIGTGKDLDDYVVEGERIKAHLVDIADAGEQYSLYRYKEDFEKAFQEITYRNKFPIVCGGSGMYIETALGLYDLKEVKENVDFRNEISSKTDEELIEQLKSLKSVHNTTDIKERSRLIRALEIALAEVGAEKAIKVPDVESGTSDKTSQQNAHSAVTSYDFKPGTNLIFGLDVPRQIIRERITDRLKKRLETGLIEEVQRLHLEGVSYDALKYYGLEYKYITLYLEKSLTFNEMFNQLNTAIHQFAKRQMTWFRRMEKRGIHITWLPNDAEMVIKTIKSRILLTIYD